MNTKKEENIRTTEQKKWKVHNNMFTLLGRRGSTKSAVRVSSLRK